jgi:AraC-like DNA-binding protein
MLREVVLSTQSLPEQVKFWRDPELGNTEMLCATYVTHSFSRHTHDGYAIGVIESGVEEFTYQGATHRAFANNIVIIHPGEVHTGHAGIPAGWKYRMLYPDASLLQRAISEVKEGWSTIPYFPNPVIQDEQLAGQVCRLHIALETSSSKLERESRFLWTLAQLIIRHADDRPYFTPISQEHESVQRVRDYLNTDYANSISLKQLAHLANLKPLRLLRVFQQEVGLPPHAYLVQVRIARARELLKLGMPIVQVACETGFTDQSHLNRHFKRLVGVTPGQYAIGCK